MSWVKRVRRRIASERGAGLVEYALLVALIAVVCITAVVFLGTSGTSKFDGAGTAISGKPKGTCHQFTDPSGAVGHWYSYPDGSSQVGSDPGPCP